MARLTWPGFFHQQLARRASITRRSRPACFFLTQNCADLLLHVAAKVDDSIAHEPHDEPQVLLPVVLQNRVQVRLLEAQLLEVDVRRLLWEEVLVNEVPDELDAPWPYSCESGIGSEPVLGTDRES